MDQRKGDCSSSMFRVAVAVGVLIGFLICFPFLIPIALIVFFVSYLVSMLKFYNRENCLSKIGRRDLLNQELTNKILLRQGIVKLGQDRINLDNIRSVYENILKSVEVKFCNKALKIDNVSRNPFLEYNIQYGCKPLVLRFANRQKRGLVFYVFPETVLAFAEGVERKVFIGAYDLRALRIDCAPVIYPFNVIVAEKTKNPIEYYYRYSPVPDAQIAYCDWTIKNLDGSRSFKGGLLPEHNPLKFELRYARVQYNFGQLSTIVEYSNYSEVKRFTESYIKYLRITKR